MIPDLPLVIYWLVTGMAVLELLAAGAHLPNLYGVFLTLRICTCLAGVVFIAVCVGRPPLFGPFEAAIYIVFVMGVLARVFQKNWGYQTAFVLFNSLGVLIILLLQQGKPMALNEDYFMYGNLWVNLFFNLRLLAAAFLAHGASQYLGHMVEKEQRDLLSTGGRNTLLAGACVYLTSEWAGSLWCLNWFGDSWQWSRGFFKASILFLLIMVVCHLPSFINRNKRIQGISGMLPGLFILWMIFYH
ncbi:MAG: hypothetical protein KKF12_12765 [Proteobacteria bacterium]|nr:hypothetical protein [Desulfobacula sp.]MBU3951719.1 hypothetical protein [Pseudomonadota bacterium]MBU4131685.1 hypothetical protein [Pseudomonadota bacterium]